MSDPLEQTFQQASQLVNTLRQKPANDELLKLYALFKQATEGDVSGEKPSPFDIKGQFKYEAWKKEKGTDPKAAQEAYIELVQGLIAKYGTA
jgi:diazepam-binding inhibitor (GABA receptor modulating acyl-CoA-binding protein)